MPFDPISKPPDLRALALLALGVAPLGCDEPPPARAPVEVVAPAPQMPASDAANVEVEPPAELLEWLAAQAVPADDALRGRPVVYTWTRAERIEEIRAHRRLLTRTQPASGERPLFDASLDGDPHPLARHLARHPVPRRYGWTNPWATRRGWPGGEYGDRLIEIELRADAWFATFDASASEDRWRVRTLGGEEVSEREVARDPARVAAIFHIGRGVGPEGDARVFREVVVVSERWIKRFSFGTDEIGARLADDRERLTAFASYLDARGAEPDASAWAGALFERWRAPLPDDASVTELYDRALAMSSTEVLPDAAHVRAIADALSVPNETALVVDEPRPTPMRPRQPPPSNLPPYYVT